MYHCQGHSTTELMEVGHCWRRRYYTSSLQVHTAALNVHKQTLFAHIVPKCVTKIEAQLTKPSFSVAAHTHTRVR